ncbi:MAG TPA: competence/damage-inducible protein A [Gemmatimonadaceae bacterium]
MNVELITIGDELLLGFTIDTNGAFLARKVAERGVAIVRRTSVGDTMDAIVAAVREALDRTGAVITTGGLGPTTDDLSRDAVAKVFGREMEVDQAHLEWMRNRWKTRFGRELPESNVRQAMLPVGARKLENKYGSAPGVYIEDDRGRWVAMLPGVPREMRGMTDDVLLPLLAERGAWSDHVIRSRTLRTTGIAESLLQDRITGIEVPAGISLAYLPGVDGVDLRITTEGMAEVADRSLGALADALRKRVGEWVYAEGDADMAAVLLELCRAKKMRIAVAESCTGGMLGARLTAIPGSSDVFVGGVIAYANEVKLRELGVSQRDLDQSGAVSEPVVRQMASGARQKFGVEVGLGISGVAGPGGGTPEKPVGLVWVAAAVGDRVESKSFQSVGDRAEVRYRGAQAVMELARRMLK